MMKKTVTWVVVADGRRVRVFRNDGPGKGVEPIREEEDAINPRTRQQGTDRPGRVQESVGGARHSVEPQDLHQAQEAAFARRLGAELSDAARRDAFDRLVLIAAPKCLGDVRSALDDHARSKVIGEIDKDLTKASREDVERQLGSIIAV